MPKPLSNPTLMLVTPKISAVKKAYVLRPNIIFYTFTAFTFGLRMRDTPDFPGSF